MLLDEKGRLPRSYSDAVVFFNRLYFLKNAYRTEGFFYNEWMDQENETLFTSGDYVWGVTGENLACLVLQKTEHVTKE